MQDHDEWWREHRRLAEQRQREFDRLQRSSERWLTVAIVLQVLALILLGVSVGIRLATP